MAEPCEHDYEISGLIKDEEFLGQLSDYLFLKNDCCMELLLV
jgi:hypothetical protein